MGKETLEEVAGNFFGSGKNYNNRLYFVNGFKNGSKWKEETILDWLDNQIEVGKDCDGDTRGFEMMKTYINNL